MRIGIFAKTFVRPALAQTFSAVRACGLDCVQFNMSCAGLPAMPDRIDPGDADSIRQEAERQGICLSAISGTFNMIDPDPEKRKIGLRRLRVLAAACRWLHISVITLCTGSRDPENMWKKHPGNNSTAAWSDLIASTASALEIAEEQNVTLAIEPEVSNVVDSADKAGRLLDEMRSPRLKIVMDGANLFHAGELPGMRQVLQRAFDRVGEDIVLAHAKDLSRDGVAGQEAAGTGLLDYDLYLSLLREVGYRGPLILHGLGEGQVVSSVTFLRDRLQSLEMKMSF